MCQPLNPVCKCGAQLTALPNECPISIRIFMPYSFHQASKVSASSIDKRASNKDTYSAILISVLAIQQKLYNAIYLFSILIINPTFFNVGFIIS